MDAGRPFPAARVDGATWLRHLPERVCWPRRERPARCLGLLLALALIVAPMSGCLSLFLGRCDYAGAGFTIEESVDGGPGVFYADKWFAWLPVGESLSISIVQEPFEGCPAVNPAAYEWTITTRPPADEGGLPTRHITTTEPTLEVPLPYVGEYMFTADLIDDKGKEIKDTGSLLTTVKAYFVTKNITLPTDGSSYETTFEAFCCIGGMAIDINVTEPGFVGSSWVKTITLERDGREIWQGRGSGRDATHHFQEELGNYWLETFRLSIAADPMAQLPVGMVSYEADIMIGPWAKPISGW